MKRRLIVGLGILVILAAIAMPTYLLLTERAGDAEKAYLADAQAKFIAQYGTGNQILKSKLLDKVLVAYWQDSEYVHVSVELGEAWIEVYRVPLVSDNGTGSK